MNRLTALTAWLKSNKLTAGLIVGVILILVGAFLFYKSLKPAEQELAEDLPEVELLFEEDGPYAILTPRRDGNALVLSIKRVAAYDSFSYELAYSSEGIDRGVAGDIKTDEKKGEYQQEILFGSCSKNVCKYDKGVENGTLTVRFRKGNQPYRVLIAWHMQEPDLALGKLTSADGHFRYTLNTAASGTTAKPAPRPTAKAATGGEQAEGVDDLSIVGFTIINELTGVPKLPDGKKVSGKVYALNTPLAKTVPPGEIVYELAETPSSDAAVYRYDEDKNAWSQLETKANGSTFTAKSDKGGIFAVLTNK